MTSLRHMLADDFAARQRKNAKFSLRAYARWLGVNSATLSQFMRGKRRLSAVNEEKIRAMLAPDSQDEVGQRQDYQKLEDDELATLSDWYYFAILSLFEVQDFQDDPLWISEKLSLPLLKVQDALARLERLGMLRRDHQGRRQAAGISYTTSDQKLSLALQHGHMQSLDIARWAINHEDISKREVSAMTMAIDPSRLPEAQRRIKAFRRRLCQYLESGDKKQVYRLSVHLLPLSHTTRPSW